MIPALFIFEGNQLVYQQEIRQTMELGRQRQEEQPPFALIRMEGRERLIVAPLEEARVARRQLLVEPLSPGELRLSNLSENVALSLLNGQNPLPPKESVIVRVPVSLTLTGRQVITFDAIIPTTELNSLGEKPEAPGNSSRQLGSKLKGDLSRDPGDQEQLLKSLQVVMDVFQCATDEQALFTSAVDGAISLVGLDSARILLLENGQWREVYLQNKTEKAQGIPASRQVLDHVERDRQTFWKPAPEWNPSKSLQRVQTVIAAPILAPDGRLIGSLYGDRQLDLSDQVKGQLTSLEAHLVELLACGVASGLARFAQENRARQLKTQFEQFFTAELARELEENPTLLEGRDAEVSILFCDLRGFSRISERIGTQQTFAWIQEVMGMLSECVLKHQGVLVDYLGDELMAMWGAPQPEPQHAELACQAALEMLERLPDLNRLWESKLGEPMEIGIGINSGPVRAGNAGSRLKFKYSALGNTVNLASRIQGANKTFRTRVLISGSTAEQLPPDLPKRRVADVRVVNIYQPVSLWELAGPCNEGHSELCTQYQRALTAFEEKAFPQAARELSEILRTWPNDGPSLVLLKRSVNALVDGPLNNHPTWELDSK